MKKNGKMKEIGVILVSIALGMGIFIDLTTLPSLPDARIGLAFCFFILGMYFIIIENSSCLGRIPKMKNPPRPPEISISFKTGEKSTDGRCETCHSETHRDGGTTFKI